jgi:hypothetical protein
VTEAHVRQLKRLALVILVATPTLLACFAIGASVTGADVVESARASAVCIMVVLAAVIFAPLVLDQPPDAKRRGFVVFWFIVSAFFNATWQVPLILFRDTITTADPTHENLRKFIAWWGYGFADSHYGQVSRWMMAEELWWLLAILISVVGLVTLRRGRESLGFLLLGVAGALESYNASLYIVENWLVDGFSNIADGSLLSLALYWGFNPLWAFAAALASYYSFGFVLARAESTENAAPSAGG